MNFGRDGIRKKQGSVTSKATKYKGKLTSLALKTLLFVGIVGCISIGLYIFGIVKAVVDETPEITLEDVKPNGFPSTIVDKDGNPIQTLTGVNANRSYVTIDEIPIDVQHAFVAIEDSRFYEHNGIDPQGIARAAFVGISHGFHFTEGASTLTQQLLKNAVFDPMSEKDFSDSLKRKIQEVVLAVKFEKIADKDTIMEYYLNTINLGQNTLGIGKASERYFAKEPSELTLSEAAVIASITQNPSKYNPINNPEYNAERRAKVLGDMEAQGYITKEQKEEALADDVYTRIAQVNAVYEEAKSATSSYYADAVCSQVLEDLQEQLGYTYDQAVTKLYSGGLTITSAMDPQIQKIVDEEINNDSNYPYGTKLYLEYAMTVTYPNGDAVNHSSNELLKYLKGIYGDNYTLLYNSTEEAQADIDSFKQSLEIPEDAVVVENTSLSPQPQASIVIIDQYTGLVKAIGGGRGPKTTSMSFNRATDAKRQPGSCFKVLSTYAPAIDAKGYTLYTPIVDEPFNYDSGRPVNNWYSGYWGTVTLRYAIAQSMNVCAVKTLTEITPRLGYDYLLKFGFTTLVDGWEAADGKIYTDVAQPLALGGITKGVTNLEITAAYATIANGGVYTKPRFYTNIVDHDGKDLIVNEPQTRRVLKDSTAALLTDGMQDVITMGTGGGAALRNMPVSGKTGTTTNNNDIWFCGFTPYYTCSVWGGYDTYYEMSNTTWHMVLWRSIMNRVHDGLVHRDFEYPSSVKYMSVCSETGMLPRAGCPVTYGLFAVTNQSNEYCNVHSDWSYSQTDDDDDQDDDDGQDDGDDPTPTPEPEPTPEPAPEPTPAPEPAP